ncbi:MAG: hypothetical protein ACE3JQ_01090 [Paenisporosarcina sp.]
MIKSRLKKLFAINLIAFLLFWTAGPSVVLASFLSPGTPITPGTAITPGSPITGGQFIAPGEILTPGKSYLPGQPGTGNIPTVSGKPLIPTQPFTNGLFITPNYITSPYSGWLSLGNPMTSGEAISGGQGPNGGQVGTGGTGPNGGQVGTGGTGPNGGQVGTGGTGSNGGQPGTGGAGPNGGQVGTGGTGPNGGQAGTGGTGPNGGNAGSGELGTSGGQTGGTTESEGPSNLNVLFKSTDDSRGSIVQSFNFLRDIKTYWFGFGDKIVGPLVALNAGFDIKKIESGRLQGNYAITGKDSVKNPILNKYFQNFKEYKINGDTKKLGNGARQVKPDKIDEFYKARKIAKPGMTNKTSWQLAREAAKTSVDDAINILKLKNIAKLNGVANVALSSVNSVYDYNWGDKKSIGMGSTDFAADLTTDVAVGVGITALSTVAGSMAAGAVIGTAIPIPIAGTLVGAVVGLIVGGISTLVLNTKLGKSVKTFVRDTIKAGYDGALEVGKGISRGAVKAVKGIGEAGSKLFKSVGSMFG